MPANLLFCFDMGGGGGKRCDSYLGLNQKRLEGEEFLQVVDEFVAAAKARWPKVLIQVRCWFVVVK